MSLYSCLMLLNVFQVFNISNFKKNICNFYRFFLYQVPLTLDDLLFHIVSRVNGIVINILITPILAIFG